MGKHTQQVHVGRPSIDLLCESAAAAYGNRAISVITGVLAVMRAVDGRG